VRVCHVSPHLPPDQAANALLPAELGRWTTDAGGTVTYVAHEAAQGGQTAAAPLPGQVWWMPRRPRRGVRRLLRIDSLQQARAVARAMDEAARAADLVHLHSNGLIIEAAAGWARRHDRPHALTLYGTEIWHYRKRRPIDPFTRAYTGAGAVTFYSRGLADKARELGLTRPAMHVVYPAVRETFAPQDAATRERWRHDLGIDEPHVLLNVKRLHELAGQRFLIEAFARIARTRDDVRLIVCGTGPLQEALEAQARHARVSRQITFTGLVSNDLVARYAAVADVFVLPSLLEALPTVAVEALASGTPVISADHPGGVELHGIFDDDVQLVPRSESEQLAAAMLAAVEAPRRVSAATLERVAQHFGPQAVHAAYDAIYHDLLRRPS
jgi:glycosyltransferase involved in cell wall biosynthesis